MVNRRGIVEQCIAVEVTEDEDNNWTFCEAQQLQGPANSSPFRPCLEYFGERMVSPSSWVNNLLAQGGGAVGARSGGGELA